MKHCYDLTGQVYGRLTAVKRVPKPIGSKRAAWWLCKCECGNDVVVSANYLTMGRKTHCGCNKPPIKGVKGRNTKHGQSQTRLYKMWIGIKGRCNNPTCSTYPNYGGKGIVIDREWNDKFEAFMDWSLSHGYAENLSIDRIDPSGNYCPDNCRWVGKDVQAFNQRMKKNNTTGYTGVSYFKDRKKYVASIGYKGKYIYLGSFDTVEEAAEKREEANRKYYGHLAVK